MLIFFILYLIGCFGAFAMLSEQYESTPLDERCDNSEACVVYCVGTMLSWITVLLFIYRDLSNN